MWMDSWVLARPRSLWDRVNLSDGSQHPLALRVFASQRPCVVLARSNRIETEVDSAACQRLGIPILRRRGGGGTVVLGPGCQIVTLAFFARSLFENALLFRLINGAWIEAMSAALGSSCPAIAQRGISDLAVGDRKVAGTSLFRRKHLVVFQGSLLVDPDLDLMSQLLLHPSREPDYRSGRTHRDFVTSLLACGVDTTAEALCSDVRPHLLRSLTVALDSEFCRERLEDSL